MELFNYLLKVSACSVLFFAFYLLVLRKLTFFKLNRFYLLATLLLSFLIPALNVTIEKQVEQILPIAEETATVNLPSQVETVMPTEVFPLQTSRVTPSFDWFSLLPYGYAVVVLVLMGIGLWQLSTLLWHARRNQKTDIGLKLVAKKSGFTNCSFFNYVFVDQENLTEQELAVLLRHEQVHAEQYHSIDKMIMMVAKAVMWFNPVVYLWDKTLEQVHEYEADEATANSFNTRDYAELLLSLAVSQCSTSLIHNFVKSPIKERIKMLFNSKSKNMKKLMYLLVAPVLLGLLWSFTVDVVEVQVPQASVQAKNKIDPVIGKKLKGVVDSVTTETKFTETIHFRVDGKTYLVRNLPLVKVKKDDELTILISGKREAFKVGNDKGLVSQLPIYTMSQAYNAKGDSLIIRPKIQKHAFLYEGNKARFTTSKISRIEKNANGYIKKIHLNDGSFSIVFDVNELKTKASNFKVGNEVEVKFIGEKLVAKNTYVSSKLIAMYSSPKKYEIINSNLYSRFYSSEGFQKVDGKAFEPKADKLSADVKIVSAAKAESFPKRGITNLDDAVLMINGVKLEASKVFLDRGEGGITAKDATIYFPNGDVKKYKLLTYNANQKSFVNHEYAATNDHKLPKVISGPGKEGELELSKDVSITKMRYQASDSVRVNRIFETMLLSGKAELDIEKYKARGKVIQLDNLNKMVTVYLGSVNDENNLKIEAEVIEIDLKNNRYTTKNHFK